MSLSDSLYKPDWVKALRKDLARENELLELKSKLEFKQGDTISIGQILKRSQQPNPWEKNLQSPNQHLAPRNIGVDQPN